MKLILTQEVTGLGAPGDIVEVKDGYGRNFLIPRGLGIRWTRGGEKTIESIKQARASREVRDLDHAKEIKAKLEGSTFSLPVRAGEGGRLFGAVTVSDIADAIAGDTRQPSAARFRGSGPAAGATALATRGRYSSAPSARASSRKRSRFSPARPGSPTSSRFACSTRPSRASRAVTCSS
jgi:ribosomal protein L9